MYEMLGIDLDKGYQPVIKSSTGKNMGALGQTTYTFKINNTQSFTVCRHMTRHMILGTDFTATNFVGVIWTREGTQTNAFQQKHHHRAARLNITNSSGTRLFSENTPRRQPYSSIGMYQTGNRQNGYQIDVGFHHRNPNVYIPPSFVNNPNNTTPNTCH